MENCRTGSTKLIGPELAAVSYCTSAGTSGLWAYINMSSRSRYCLFHIWEIQAYLIVCNSNQKKKMSINREKLIFIKLVSTENLCLSK